MVFGEASWEQTMGMCALLCLDDGDGKRVRGKRAGEWKASDARIHGSRGIAYVGNLWKRASWYAGCFGLICVLPGWQMNVNVNVNASATGQIVDKRRRS